MAQLQQGHVMLMDQKKTVGSVYLMWVWEVLRY